MKNALHPTADSPKAFVAGGVSARHPQPTPPTVNAGAAPTGYYVDPYLFETGFYASRAEEEELTRTFPARVQLREEAEYRPKRRPPRKQKPA